MLLRPAGATLLLSVAAPCGRLAMRGGRPMMCNPIYTPPAPPAAPPVDRGYGGDNDASILLSDMTMKRRNALLSVWGFQYEVEADGDDTNRDVRAAKSMSQWIGDLAPSGWFGMFRGRTLGAYLGSRGSPRGPSPEALVVVRYKIDASEWRRILLGKHVLVVDQVLLSPSVPDGVRGALHAAVLQSLCAMGGFHQMTVAYLDDFGI